MNGVSSKNGLKYILRFLRIWFRRSLLKLLTKLSAVLWLTLIVVNKLVSFEMLCMLYFGNGNLYRLERFVCTPVANLVKSDSACSKFKPLSLSVFRLSCCHSLFLDYERSNGNYSSYILSFHYVIWVSTSIHNDRFVLLLSWQHGDYDGCGVSNLFCEI